MMAETIVSPGVLAIENDQSFITQQPVQAGAAIIGPTVKGKVGIPTIVTTYSDYLNKFGSTFLSGSSTYTFLTSITAYNYFAGGGNTLLVTRVVSGSTATDWTFATSSFTRIRKQAAVLSQRYFDRGSSTASLYSRPLPRLRRHARVKLECSRLGMDCEEPRLKVGLTLPATATADAAVQRCLPPSTLKKYPLIG